VVTCCSCVGSLACTPFSSTLNACSHSTAQLIQLKSIHDKTHLAQLLEEAECFLAGGLQNQSHRQLTADRALDASMCQMHNIPFLELSVCHQHRTKPAHACQTWLLFLLRQLLNNWV
jgi:hypothetical protein